MLEKIFPKIKSAYLEALRKPVNKLTETTKRNYKGTDVSKISTHKLRSIEASII